MKDLYEFIPSPRAAKCSLRQQSSTWLQSFRPLSFFFTPPTG